MLFSAPPNIPGDPTWTRALNIALNSQGAAFNFNPKNTFNLRAAVANTRRGIANTKLAFLGDSTTRGRGSGTTTAQALNGFPFQLADMFTQLGLTGGKANILGGGNYTPSAFDSRVALSGTAAMSANNQSLGGSVYTLNSSTANVAFTIAQTCDTFDIYFIAISGNGTMNCNLDGGANLGVLNGNQSSSIQKLTVSGSAAAHVLNVFWVSGALNLLIGVHAYNSATKEVSCLNFGADGWTTAQMRSTSAVGYSAGQLAALQAYAPACSFISMGTNDVVNGVSLTTSLSNMQAEIDMCKLVGDVILITPWGIAQTAGNWFNMGSWQQAFYDLAIANNIPLIDVYGCMPDWVASNAALLATDTLHPNGAGYAMYAQAVIRALELVI